MTSALALFGDKVFPIQTNEEGILTVAGAEYGKVDLTNPLSNKCLFLRGLTLKRL